MAEQNPTVIIAHLDDEKLRKSIDSLVGYVDEKFKAMTASTANAVNSMQAELNKLGSLNAKGVGGAGGGELGITKALQRAKQEAKESSKTFDQMAASMQKATTGNGNKTIFSTMDTEISILKERLVEAKSQVESFTAMARRGAETGDKGLFTFSTENLHKYEAEVERLTQQINSLTAQRQSLREMLNPQGDAFKNYVDSLTKANPELAALNAQYKRGTSLLQEQKESIEQKSNAESQSVAKIQEELELEQRQREEQAKLYDIQTERNRQLELENAKTAENLAFQERINAARQAKETGEGKRVRETNELTGAIAGLLGIQEKEVAVTDIESASQHRLANYLNQLKTAYQRLDQEGMNASHGKMLADEIQRVSRAYAEMTKQMNRPTSLKNALGSDENTLDRIAYKMQQLNAYKMGLDITDPKQVAEMKLIEQQYDRLKKKSDELMGKNQQLMNSNNALARSWNYMKNRLAFYFTVGASTAFVKNLIEIRSQYEMNERALGILIDSAERGTQIFNELSQMALVSPYTLIELSNAAKQLTAYDVAAKDVVDTTRRLADMASAVGIPIERLTYALGQIKAYGYLNSRDARMFLNAGIPLIKNLADHYTELEGKMVSVGDVYDRMKKKAIDYNDVMQVITEMTDEGGKFFDFQAKMADTLKVQLANLTLAWNNMLNEIGKSEQGVLVGGIKGLKELFLQWEKINTLVRNLAITFGFAKLAQVIQIATLGMDAFGKKMVWQILVGKKLQVVLYNIVGSLKAIVTSPLTWWALLATAIVSAGMALYDANKALKEFNKSIADGGKENYENTKKFLQQYQDLRNELQIKNGTLKDGRTTPAAGVSKDEAEKAWVAIREQIELTSQSSDYFIGTLLSIDDVNKRVEKGFDYLQKIQDVYGAMSSMDDDTIAIKETYNAWWNLGLAQDGVIGNLKEYIATKKLVEEEEKKGAAWHETETVFAKRIESLWSSADIALQQYRHDLDVTLESMAKFAQTQGFDFDQEKEFFSQTINKIVTSRNLGEREALQFRLDAEERYKDARIKQFDEVIEFETKRAGEAAAGAEKDRLLLRVKAAQQEKAAWLANQEGMYGEGRVLFEGFTKYMTRNHGSELQKLFGNMTKKEIEQINWSEPRWKKWAEDNAKAFAEQFGVSFDKLKKYVNDANQMTIFIKTIVQTPDDKSVYDTLTEADKAADEAWTKIQRLKTRKGELEAKGASMVGTSDIDTEYANTLQEITEAQDEYNDALAKGGHSKKEDKNATKEQKQAETELQKALKDELQLLDKVRSQYKKLTDAGVDGTTALNMVTNQFTNSIQRINNILGRNGLPLFNIKTFAGTDNPNAVLEMLKKQLDAAKVAKNIKPEEIKELEVKYGEIVVDAKVYNTKKITDGLNNELSKIKDEYELAVELDANPELGGAFADLFGINTDELPKTFGEAFDRANKVAKDKLEELKVDVKDFDLLSTNIKGDENGFWMGIDVNSDFFKELTKGQQQYREMLKKNLTETEKALDDYVKKYGDYSDRIAEIEADRIEKIKRLNDAYYTEEMRKLPEYIAKLNAIEEGARREKQSVEFDDFKNSRYYTQMFENLDHVSSVTLRAMRDRLREVIDTMNGLTPEQLKQVMSQYEKIEQKLIKRNPFKNLTKDLKEYIKTSKERKEANKAWAEADKEYNAQKKVVATIKEKIKQEKAKGNTSSQNYLRLLEELGVEQEILDILKQQVDAAEEKAQKYNLIKNLVSEEAEEFIKMVSGNLSSLPELRDTLDSFGINLGDDLDAIIDDLGQVGEGMNQILSSAQSGNVVGVTSGVVKTVGGLWDSVSSIFGGGAAKTKRLNREIDRSKESVRQLQMAYKGLERAVERGTGTAETQARREQIANKEAELAELQRQMQLEQSKRSKDRDDEAIKQYQEAIQDLEYEIEDLKDEIVNNLWGSDVKSAAEDFVDTWVEAWRAGETTLDAMNDKMDEMIYNLIKKAMTSKIVEALLKPLYDDLDAMTSEDSKGGVDLTTNELRQLAQKAGTTAEDINTALGEFYGNLESLDIVSKTQDKSKELSALQQGIQGITEETAGALEAYWNANTQQQYVHTDLLTQIRDAVVAFDNDVQVATNAQILLQLQQSYAVQMAIQSILIGWSSPSGMAVRVEMQ